MKDSVWTKTITKGVVWKIHKSNERLGISKVRDHTFFIKHSESKGVIVLLMYVDDIIVTRYNKEEKIELIRKLMKEFKSKNLED